jgi:hypothetical protein
MPKQPASVSQHKLTGKITMDGKPMNKVTDLEINPATAPWYVITMRVQLDEPVDEVHNPYTMTKKRQEMMYENPFLGRRWFNVDLVDSGIVDMDGKCTLVLFFKAQGKPDPKESLPIKPASIIL